MTGIVTAKNGIVENACKKEKPEREVLSEISELSTMGEIELRDYRGNSPKSLMQLIKTIESLVYREHEYGTAVYAASICAYSTFMYVCRVLGLTGFQAECADLDFLSRTRGYSMGFMILDYRNLLYPQYYNDEHFPSKEQLLYKNLELLAKEAAKKIETIPTASPKVLKHWGMIVNKWMASITPDGGEKSLDTEEDEEMRRFDGGDRQDK